MVIRTGKEVKSRGIIFKGEMVRAILEGRKSQTRLAVKPQPNQDQIDDWLFNHGKIKRTGLEILNSLFEDSIECPYGQPGDQLWVRETWALTGGFADVIASELDGDTMSDENIKYRADQDSYDDVVQSWRPSVHMQKWASRINLEITNVRIECLQDISDDDARSEGISKFECIGLDQRIEGPQDRTQRTHPHVVAFASFWDSSNFYRGHGWIKNPHVWVVEFKKI